MAASRYIVETGLQALLASTATERVYLELVGDSVLNMGAARSGYNAIRNGWPQMANCIAIGVSLNFSDFGPVTGLGVNLGFSDGVNLGFSDGVNLGFSDGVNETHTNRYSNGALLSGDPRVDATFATGDRGIGGGITRDTVSTATNGGSRIYQIRAYADASGLRANFTAGLNPRYRLGWFKSALLGQASAPNIKYRRLIANATTGAFVSAPSGNTAILPISNNGGLTVHAVTPTATLSADQTAGIMVDAEYTAIGQHAYLGALMIEHPTATAGFGLVYTGHGGAAYNSHLDINDSDADTTVRPLLQDACLDGYYAAIGYPDVIALHCYNGFDGWGDTAKFTRVVEKAIARRATVYLRAGRELPLFLLPSPFATRGGSVQKSSADQMAAIMESIAVSGVTTAHTAPLWSDLINRLSDPNNAGFYATIPGGAAGKIAFVNAREQSKVFAASHVDADGAFDETGANYDDFIHPSAAGSAIQFDTVLRGAIEAAVAGVRLPGVLHSREVRGRAVRQDAGIG